MGDISIKIFFFLILHKTLKTMNHSHTILSETKYLIRQNLSRCFQNPKKPFIISCRQIQFRKPGQQRLFSLNYFHAPELHIGKIGKYQGHYWNMCKL